MRQLTTLIVSIILLAFTGQAAAQFRNETRVYETTDQDGVPLYSDIPTQGARPVIIPPTNPADSVEVRPPATPEPELVQSAPQPGTPEYQRKVNQQLEEYRQREREIRRERHGGTRHKVGTGTDSQRREVGDSGGSR